MLEIVPKFFSLQENFDIFDGARNRGHSRTPLLVLNPPHTLLTIDGIQYRIMRYPKPITKWWQLEFTLKLVHDQGLYLNDKPLAIARPQYSDESKLFGLNFFSYVVEYENSLFEIGLKSESVLSPEITILESSSQTNDQTQKIGRIYVPGLMSNRKVIELPERIPLFLQVFFFALSRSWMEPQKPQG